MRFRKILSRLWPTEATAHLGLGSNVGDRLATLKAALADLQDHDGIEVTDVSGVYDTAPVSDVEQGTYLNMVVAVSTRLRPRDLLEATSRIEAAHGRDRTREVETGPRTLDIDILLYGDAEIDEPDLTIPHPRMTERAFVIVPLMEVLPGGRLPDGTRLSAVVGRLAPIEGIDLHVRLDEVPGRPTRPGGPRGPGAFLRDEWDDRESRRPPGAPPGVYR